MAVEVHYEDSVIVQNPDGSESMELRHWRIIVDDEEAAVAQAGQDVAEGRNPVAVMARSTKDPWNYRKEYDPSKWRQLVGRTDLRRRARSVGPALQ